MKKLINCHTERSPRGFTLIELLVVIAIIAILAAILFPVFARARERARATACLSNAKQIGLGLMQYMQDFDETYPTHLTKLGTTNVCWMQMVAPYIKNNQVYTCPSRSDIDYTGVYDLSVAYGMNYWMNSWYYPLGAPRLKMAAISRPAETVWIAETGNSVNSPGAGYNQSYPSCYGAVYVRSNAVYGFDVPTASGRLTDRHFGGLNVIWGDGHAKWIRRELLENDVHDDGVASPANPGSKYWWGR